MSAQHLSEQEVIRREKLSELQNMGIDAYPAALFPVNSTSVYIKENYKGEENKNNFADVCLAGRLMSHVLPVAYLRHRKDLDLTGGSIQIAQKNIQCMQI